MLDDALEAYKSDYGRYPATLVDLSEPPAREGGELPIDESLLHDPWGQTMQYDPAGPRHGGEKPDVWCLAPNGNIIGNWRGGRGE